MLPDWFQKFRPRIGWLEYNQNLQIDLVNRYVYFEVAKAACSTVKARLRKVVVRDLPLNKEIHPSVHSSPFVKPFQLPDDMMQQVLEGDGYQRFTFIREPVERVLSAYMDTIARPKNQKIRFINRFMPDRSPDDDISFDEFTAKLAENSDFRTYDKHWRPQTELLLWPEQQYDFIGRVGRFEEDWQKLADRLGMPIAEDTENIVWHATSASEKTGEFVTPDIRRRLLDIYARDAELYEQL